MDSKRTVYSHTTPSEEKKNIHNQHQSDMFDHSIIGFHEGVIQGEKAGDSHPLDYLTHQQVTITARQTLEGIGVWNQLNLSLSCTYSLL